jgi:bifunctional DNA-binding transcriptional regulator/antitoxin component of YhaV-PrlF toxin-antitoxin module
MARRSEKESKVGEAAVAYDAAPPAVSPTSPRAGRVVLGGQRRIVLPPEATRHLGVDVGDRIVLFYEPDGSLRLRSAHNVAKSFIGLFSDFKKSAEGSVVDDFIADRRAEARREELGL